MEVEAIFEPWILLHRQSGKNEKKERPAEVAGRSWFWFGVLGFRVWRLLSVFDDVYEKIRSETRCSDWLLIRSSEWAYIWVTEIEEWSSKSCTSDNDIPDCKQSVAVVCRSECADTRREFIPIFRSLFLTIIRMAFVVILPFLFLLEIEVKSGSFSLTSPLFPLTERYCRIALSTGAVSFT